MKRFQVTFIDAGNCEIESIEIEAHFFINVPGLALFSLTRKAYTAVTTECVKVVIEELK